MSASTFFFDLSGAVPWMLTGALAALILSWIWRRLFRPSRLIIIPTPPAVQQALAPDLATGALKEAHAEELSQLQDELGAARTSAVRFADEKQKLESELRSLRSRPAPAASLAAVASPAAATPAAAPAAPAAAGQDELIRLRRSELTIKNQLADAGAELSALRQQIQAHDAKAKAHDSELAKMTSQLAMRDAELDRLEMLAAAGGSGGNAVPSTERDQLKAEIARLQASLSTAAAAAKDTAQLKAQIATLQSQTAAPSAAGVDVGKLKAELETKTVELSNAARLISIRDAELDRLEKKIAGATAGVGGSATASAPAANGDLQQLRSEIAKIRAAYDSQTVELERTNHQLSMRTAELAQLEKSPSSGGGAIAQAPAAIIAERDQLKADMSEARKAYETLKAEHTKAETALFNVGPEIEELRKFRASHAAEVARLTTQVGTLTADLENFRRFKDALDAANKIAGQRS